MTLRFLRTFDPTRTSLAALACAVVAPAAAQTFGSQNLVTGLADGASFVQAGDLDGDGDLDLIASAELGDSVGWIENLGGGLFAPPVVLAFVGTPIHVEVADLDGDGDLDVVGAATANGEIGWIENLGGGSFGTPVALTSGFGSAARALAVDLDADGDLDLVATGYTADRVILLENLGGAAFAAPVDLATGLTGSYGLVALDVEHDGDLDLVCASYLADTVSLLRNDGGTFAPPSTIGTVGGALWLDADDLDGDGHTDLAVTGFYDDSLVVLMGDGVGGFGPETVLSTDENGAHTVEIVDLDQNGELDLLVTAFYHGRVSMFRCVGGTWGPRELVMNQVDGAYCATAADLDGDGDPEAVACSFHNDTITWAENLMGLGPDCDGNGVPDADELAADPALDWNGDGVLDACPGGEATYCDANPNATGATGRIRAEGSPVLLDNALTLQADQLPANQFAYFVYSATQGFTNPFGGGSGALCLGAPLRRLNLTASSGAVLNSGAVGAVSLTLDLPSLPQPAALAAGEVLHFQLWHRELLPSGAPTSNTTNAISILFR